MQHDNSKRRRLNELEERDQWSRSVFDKLLRPVLKAKAYEGQIVFIPSKGEAGLFLQKRAHLDIVAQLPDDHMLSIDYKMVEWPRPDGIPSRHHWPYFFLETWSCTVPGHERRGWLYTTTAEIILWCQVSEHEDRLRCWPLPTVRIRKWLNANEQDLRKRMVENRINGRALWTEGRLGHIRTICDKLQIEGFRLDENGLVTDLLGEPVLRFLREPAA